MRLGHEKRRTRLIRNQEDLRKKREIFSFFQKDADEVAAKATGTTA